MDSNKERNQMLYSIINLNMSALMKVVYGTNYQYRGETLDMLEERIGSLILNHECKDINDWPQKHKDNLKRIQEACKELKSHQKQ